MLGPYKPKPKGAVHVGPVVLVWRNTRPATQQGLLPDLLGYRQVPLRIAHLSEPRRPSQCLVTKNVGRAKLSARGKGLQIFGARLLHKL